VVVEKLEIIVEKMGKDTVKKKKVI